MEIRLKSILTICIVNVLLTFVPVLNEAVVGSIHATGNVQKNIENLFDSVVRNNVQRGEMIRDLLKHDVEKEQEVFDTVKEGLWIPRDRNVEEKYNEGANVLLVKREIDDNTYDPGVNGEMTNAHQENGAPNPGGNDAENQGQFSYRTAPIHSSPYANWDSTVKSTYYPQRQYNERYRGTQRINRNQYYSQQPYYNRNFAQNGTQAEYQPYHQRPYQRPYNRPSHYRNEYDANAPSRQYDRHYDAFNGNYTTSYYSDYNSFVPSDQQFYSGSSYNHQSYNPPYGQSYYDYTPQQYYHSQPAANPNYREQYNDPRYGQQHNYPQQQYIQQYPQQGNQDFRQTPSNSDQLQSTVRAYSSIADVPLSTQQNNSYSRRKKSKSMNAKTMPTAKPISSIEIVPAAEMTTGKTPMTTKTSRTTRQFPGFSVRNVPSYSPRRWQQQEQEGHQQEQRQSYPQARQQRRQRVNRVSSTTLKPPEEEKTGRFSRLCKFVKGVFRKITFCKDEDEDEDKEEPKQPEQGNNPHSYDRIDQRTSSYRPYRNSQNRNFNNDPNYRPHQNGPSRFQKRNPDTNYFGPLSTGNYRRVSDANNQQGNFDNQKKRFNYKPYHYNYNHPDVYPVDIPDDQPKPGNRDHLRPDANSANSNNPDPRASPSYVWRYATSTPRNAG